MKTRPEIAAAPDLLLHLRRDEVGDLATEEMLVNMGPQHPATHGVLRVVLRTDGEVVREATPHIGYLHRCAEKIGENLQPYQFIPKTDRMDYLAAMNNNYAFSLAIEELCGMEVPERGRYLRTIAAELNRLASHLVSFGTYGLDMGAFTPFLHAFREREYILDLFEALCGARLTYSYIFPGGPTLDLPDGFVERTREFLDYFEPKIDEYNRLLSFNYIFIKRTAGVGIIPAATALAYGMTGPCLRASGVKWDLRRTRPYDLYDRFEFDVPIGSGHAAPQNRSPQSVAPAIENRKSKIENQHSIPPEVVIGDCWNRYFVRMQEMKESVRILRQALDQLPKDGPIRVKGAKNVKLPPRSVYFEAENPRGQLGFYIEGDGSAIPYRVKARGPSFCNLSVLHEVCRNVLLGDVPAIIGSIDIVMGEVDR